MSQPTTAAPPIFNPDAQDPPTPAQPNHPMFGQALREQLDSDRVPGDDTDHAPEALETDRTETAPEPTPPPLVSEAAPWVAARNAQIEEDAGSVPSIDVEDSPSWVTSAETEEIDAELRGPSEHDSDRDDQELAETEADLSVDDVTTDDPTPEADHAVDDHSATEEVPEDDAADETSAAITADTSSDEAEAEDDAAGEDADGDVATAEYEDDALSAEAEEIAVTEEVSTEEADADIGEASDDDLVAAISDGDQLPVVMRPPAALEIQKYSPTEILAVVRAQESELVDTLIGEGVLTTSGPITDKDVRTMLFVAVSSNELIDVLTEASGDAAELHTSGSAALPKG